MRIFAIARRVTLELVRDKRTLALMFIAPLLVLTLMNYVFSVNDSTTARVATVNVSQPLKKSLQTTKHIDVEKFASTKAADKALHDDKVDTIIHEKNGDLYVTNANVDAGKTNLAKAALQGAISKNGVDTLKEHITDLSAKLATLTAQMPGAKANLAPATQAQASKIYTKYVYGDANTTFFAKIIPILMGFFVFFFVFLISGMALLRERTSGTLDRLLATPVRRADIVLGYMIAYGILAILQTLLIVIYTVWILKVEVLGSLGLVLLVNIVLALVALAFGILMSTFARSEFQMMQFIPLIIVPQVFFSGMIPLDTMASWVQWVAAILPMKYAGDALTNIVMRGVNFGQILPDLLVLILFLIILTLINIVGLRRYRKV
ncbi:ABC transporter permease [Weissella oryzae SG25]|uniref:ABC transporter permease n=1 Tax=Weissella oryzae (strain DSM 25784 / JCM 18191 / LMG 30913 / SG25) TaxID=1329250 RepID=A0A069CRV9_WEIOS|nr:ABC transporter permease [Weissella oryzae]GAK30117.1 ABC transporter permease [Weissella oryzae SG25]